MIGERKGRRAATRIVARAAMAGALAIAPVAVGIEGAAEAEARRAVVVGIDKYRDEVILSTLHGAVNDAEDLGQTFRDLDFDDVTVILNEEARRDRILEAWQSALERSAPGDTVFFTYAGHGMRAPARVEGAEEDGMDEFLPLYDFTDQTDGPKDMIVDDEFAEWIADAEARGVQVVMVIDACHSGSTFRSVDRRVTHLTYRQAGVVVSDDLFEGLDLDLLDEGPGVETPENLASFGAAQDTQKVPEVAMPTDDGKFAQRGALSYYFARGVRGGADEDGDGVVAFGEMKQYLERNIRHATNGQQTPSIVSTSDQKTVIEFEQAETTLGAQPDAPLRVDFLNLGDEDEPVLDGVEIVFPGDPSDLLWDAATGDVISGIDTIVARGVASARLQGVVDRHRAAKKLTRLAEKRALDVLTEPLQPTYSPGTLFDLVIADAVFPYRAALAIDSDGKIAFLYPWDDAERAPSSKPELRFSEIEAEAPFGSDLLVAIASDQPPTLLIEQWKALSDESEQTGGATAMQAVEAISAAMTGLSYRLGFAAVYTCAEGDEAC